MNLSKFEGAYLVLTLISDECYNRSFFATLINHFVLSIVSCSTNFADGGGK